MKDGELLLGKDLNLLEKNVGRDISYAGIVTNIEHKVSKRGKNYASFTIEDFSDSHNLALFYKLLKKL